LPSNRVTDPTVNIKQFDVVGADGKIARFVRHVGMSLITGPQNSNEVPVVDMAPPLKSSEKMKADVFGTADLTADEERKLKSFIDRHVSEHQSAQILNRTTLNEAYCIMPHCAPLREDDGRIVRMRFSCSGFVYEAYRRARIELVDIKSLPLHNLDTIKLAYPDCANLLERPGVCHKLGLNGKGPWPVLLCGYLFHAMARDPESIRKDRYSVQAGDEFFERNSPRPSK